MQNIKPHSDLLHQNLHFNSSPGDFYDHWRSTALVYSTHTVEVVFKTGLLILKWQFSFLGKKVVEIVKAVKNGATVSLVTENNKIQHAIISIRNVHRDFLSARLAFGVVLGLLYPHSLDKALL